MLRPTQHNFRVHVEQLAFFAHFGVADNPAFKDRAPDTEIVVTVDWPRLLARACLAIREGKREIKMGDCLTFVFSTIDPPATEEGK